MALHWKKQASVAYGYSLTRLALNTYTFFEDLSADYAENGESRENREQLDDALMDMLTRLQEEKLTVEEVDELRRSIQAQMEVIVAYTDSFRIYEYALNRAERRFITGLAAPLFTEEEFVSQLMGYLTSAGDAAVMNRRIQDIIAQLPVRFTRQKFYGMVREALSAYIGSDKRSLEDMMYLLKTSGMVGLSKEQRAYYPKLSELLSELENVSFKELTEPVWQKAQEQIRVAGEALFDISQHLQMAIEIVNDIYVICLSRADAMRDTSEEAHTWSIIKELCVLYRKKAHQIPEAVEEKLYLLEGLQESYYEKYQRMDSAPEYRDGEDASAYKSRCVEKLLSTSAFAELSEVQEQEQTVVSRDVDKAADDFAARLEPVFSACEKPVMRAIMATVLSNLPICFNSLDEIRDYVKNSLGSCTDRAERETCMELLQQLMESEDYALV